MKVIPILFIIGIAAAMAYFAYMHFLAAPVVGQ